MHRRFEEKQLVGVDDLSATRAGRSSADAAVSRRVRAVLASPLPYNQDAVGVVAVVSEQTRPWTPEGELALLAFTDLAALLVASMMQGQEQSELAGPAAGRAGLAADHRAGQGSAGGTARHPGPGRVRAAAGPGPGGAAEGRGHVRRSGGRRGHPGPDGLHAGWLRILDGAVSSPPRLLRPFKVVIRSCVFLRF